MVAIVIFGVFALLVVIVEGVHGLLVLPVHPALFTDTHNKTNLVTTAVLEKIRT